MSHIKINSIIGECRNKEGYIYDKVVILLREIFKKHAFASGNRRTAFITAKEFILENKGKFGIKDDPSNAKVMIGIREDYYAMKN